MVWWQRTHTPPPWPHSDRARTVRLGRPFRPPYHPSRVAERFHLGKNKEVFDSEHFAIHRALKIFLERYEQVVAYTIFSDSQVAIERALSDRSGPGQALARAIMDLERLLARGCPVTSNRSEGIAHREGRGPKGATEGEEEGG